MSNKTRQAPHRVLLVAFLLSLGPLGASRTSGEEIDIGAFEFFDATGFSPNRGLDGQMPYEHIDPMTGNLLLTFTDLVLPGNAGFHLKIQRTYNSKIYRNYKETGGTLAEDTWAGVGWTLHMGRIGEPSSPTAIPPPIEMPDGSQHRLYNHIDGSGRFITRDFWIYDKGSHVLQLPNGLEYTFGALVTLPGGQIYRYATRIEDPFLNSITIAYMTALNAPRDGIASITQNLGGQSRTVTFEYGFGSLKAVSSMTFDRSTWKYTHQSTNFSGFSLLTDAEPPLGQAWGYSYNTATHPRYELTRITTPWGGLIDYEYENQDFYLGSTVPLTSRVVSERSTSAPSGTWNYSYAQGSSKNKSIIAGPCNTSTYTFEGIGETWSSAWRIGLVTSKAISDASGVLETEYLYWQPSVLISNDVEMIGNHQEVGIRVPLIQGASGQPGRVIDRGGTTYSTTYTYRSTNFNDYGRPWTVAEQGEFGRTTTFTYQYGFSTRYIIDRVASEVASGLGGSFANSFSYDLSTGFKESQSIHGIPTSYKRTATGNVASTTNANNHTTKYSYRWGVLKDTTTELYQVLRDINFNGTVAWEKRRSFTTNFSYDTLFRRTEVDPPEGNSTITDYDDAGVNEEVTVRRGSSWTKTNLDGFGRPTSTLNSVGVQTDLEYDACGQRTYESYPYTSSNIGTRWTFDGLGRIKTKRNGDDSLAQYHYSDGVDVTVTDEENRVTFQNWNAFGDPREPWLWSLRDANNETWSYSYNVLGSLTLVDPPGSGGNRSFFYNTKNQLEDETHPESGTTHYTYYAAGNVKTRQDEEFGVTTYFYDPNERLSSINRPGVVGDTSIGYDGSDNRTFLGNVDVASTFGYDGADRLTSRKDVIKGKTLVTVYTPDANDNIEWIAYPSGTRVRYFYDSENRINEITDGTTSSPPYADNFLHHASGGISRYRAGNLQFHETTYHPQRYWVTDIDAGDLHLDYRQYDRVGNVREITRTGLGTQNLDYDNLDRLETVTGSWGQSSYSYDDRGNRLSKQIGSAHTDYSYSSATQRLTSASGAEPASFAYDDNGNVTGYGNQTFTYTPANMVRRATVGGLNTEYAYDGDDLRKFKATGANRRYFVHGSHSQILSEFEQTGSGPLLPVRDYVYAGNRLIASVRPPVLSVSPPALTFAAVAGGSAPASKSFTISSSGDTTLQWQATATVTGPIQWITSVSPPSGSTMPAPVAVSVSPEGLPVGTHVGYVTVTADGALGSPKPVLVRFVVTSEPALVVQPPSLVFTMVEGGDNPDPQPVDVVFSGAGDVSWNAASSASWIDLSATSGTTPSQPAVSVDGSGFSRGTYNGLITVTSAPGTPGSPRFVPVQLVVQVPPGGTCEPGYWYCEPFEGLDEGDLGGQGGWDPPSPTNWSPQVAPDPRGAGQAMLLDPLPGKLANSIREVVHQPIDTGFDISMQVMTTGVPDDARQIGKVEFFTEAGAAWGKTRRTFGALRFGSTLYLQWGPNVYQVLVEQMEADRWYHVRVEYANGKVNAYVDGLLRFSTPNPVLPGNEMEGFSVTGWDYPGAAYVDLIEGRPLTTGLVVEPLTLKFRTGGGDGPAQGSPRSRAAAVDRPTPMPGSSASSQISKLKLQDLRRKQPLSFEANRGQADSRVRFLARGSSHALLLMPDEAVLKLSKRVQAGTGDADRQALETAVLRMKLQGANPSPEVVGRDPLPGKTNYLIGRDPSKWQTGVPHYTQVAYREVYPGIDLIFHGRQHQLEYDLVVAPNADTSAIRLSFQGTNGMSVAAEGDLILETPIGEVRQLKPVIYQDIDGTRRWIEGGYVIRGQEVGFSVAAYDPSWPLVIDPVLSYATYLGGEGVDRAFAVDVDEDHNIYVAGTTDSIDFPTVFPHQGTIGGTIDAFVTKFAADGSHLVYSTYLGGAGGDTQALSMAVDLEGNAFVTGATSSTGFPLVDPQQTAYGGGSSDGFVTQLDPTGVALYSTYLGGTGTDVGKAIAVDRIWGWEEGRLFVVGDTDSPGIGGLSPTTVNQDVPIGSDVFVYRVPPNPTHNAYLVYLNGSQLDQVAGIALDNGSLYVTGWTRSSPHANPTRNPFPASPGAYQSTVPPGTDDVFVTKLDNWFGLLEYSAFIGGSDTDRAAGIALNPNCQSACTPYVTGDSDSPKFDGGGRPSFLFRLNATGSDLIHATALGETDHGSFHARAIDVDGQGNSYVTGRYGSQLSLQGCPAFGSYDNGAFLVKTSPEGAGAGCALISSPGAEGMGIAVDPSGIAYIAGEAGAGFPTTANAYDFTPGGSDAFVAKVADPAGSPNQIQFSASTYTVDEEAGLAVVVVTRAGDTTVEATVDYETSDGTASAPSDYISTFGTLTFAPTETMAVIIVPIVADSLAEDDETVMVTLTNTSGGAILGEPATATLTIFDDDGPTRKLRIRDRILPVGPNWTAQVDVPWLTLSAYSGTGPSLVTATVSEGSDPLPGVYMGTIYVEGNTGNSPQIVQVIWTVE